MHLTSYTIQKFGTLSLVGYDYSHTDGPNDTFVIFSTNKGAAGNYDMEAMFRAINQAFEHSQRVYLVQPGSDEHHFLITIKVNGMVKNPKGLLKSLIQRLRDKYGQEFMSVHPDECWRCDESLSVHEFVCPHCDAVLIFA